eukprot:COSAG06_NODE_1399_length_9580_cov_24.435292_15_plen_148_part_00
MRCCSSLVLRAFRPICAVASRSPKLAVLDGRQWAGFAGDMLNYSLFPPLNASKKNVTRMPALSVWWKPLPNNSAAAVLFNSRGGNGSISFKFEELQWEGKQALASARNCHMKSVWDDGKGAEGVFSDGFQAEVAGESAFFGIVSGCE